jgi:biopolymer transport protein ExbD
MYLDGAIITLKELEEKLTAEKKDNPELGVALQVDRLVAFKNVVRVLDVLNGLGIERLRIGAEEEK